MESPAEDDTELEMLLETLCEEDDNTPTPDKTSSSVPPTVPVPKYRDISIETFLKPQNTIAPVEVLANTKSSLIHSGDTDSSDDEDNKYGTNFNTFGKDIKKMLDIKEQLKADRNILTDNKTHFNSTASSQCNVLKPKAPVQPQAKEATKSGAQDCYAEPISGIRVINPLISYQTMGQRMMGRKFVGISRLKDEIERQQLNEDWITIGVIVSSSPVKTSQKGSKYVIWKMSNLKGDLKAVSLFLFSGAYKAFWKTAVGVVVGVLNPSIMDKRDDKGEAALSVDVPQKLLIIGKSKDLGFCKSKKKDGTNCTAFVNTDTCPVCIYHAQQEYKKCAQRPGLQAPGCHNLSALRNKVLGKNEVFYAGQSYSAIPAKKSKKLEMKDNMRLQQLSGQKANTNTVGGMAVVASNSKSGVVSVKIPNSRFRQQMANLQAMQVQEMSTTKSSSPQSLSIQRPGTSLSTTSINTAFKASTLGSPVLSKPTLSDPKQQTTPVSKKIASSNPSLSDPKQQTTPVSKKIASSNPSLSDPKQQAVPVSKKIAPSKPSLSDPKHQTTPVSKKIASKVPTKEMQSLNSLQPINDTSSKPTLSDSKQQATPVSKKIASKVPTKEMQSLNSLQPINNTSSKPTLSDSKQQSTPVSKKIASKVPNNETRPLNSPQTADTVSQFDLTNGKQSRTAVTKKTTYKEAQSPNSLRSTSKPGQSNSKQQTTPVSKKTASMASAKEMQGGGVHSLAASVTPQHSASPKCSLGSKRPATSPTSDYLSSTPKAVTSTGTKELADNKTVTKLLSPCDLKMPPNATYKQYREWLKAKKEKSASLIKAVVPVKRRKLEGIGEVEKEPESTGKLSDRFKDLLAATSSHTNLVDIAHQQAQDTYFDKMEKKEQIEEKLLSTYKLDCKAVQCLECKYTAFSKSELCKTLQHRVRVIDATKRFFQCKDCKSRTVTLDVVPTHSCKQCGGGHWQRAAMIKEKKVTMTKLSILGNDEKDGQFSSDANLNLLVPE